MKKLLAALLLSVSTVVSAQTLDPATGTISVTPNVIDPTLWTPVIQMNSGQLSQVEGSGGGPVPAYNTDTNTIRFSYFPYTVSQVRAIEQVLSGKGIVVSGFNYSWQIYNDLNNWGGTRGTLSVTGQLADKSGNVLESYFQDYSNINTGANFQTFSGTETFGKTYQLDSLGYIGLAWTGKDQNFWSGYYGPRVRNTSLTLNYSVGSTTPTTPTTTTTTTVVGVPTATEIATAASLPPPEAEPAPAPAPPPPSTEPSTNGALPPPGSEPPPGSPPPQQSSSPAPASTGSPQPVQNGSPAPANSPQSVATPTSLASGGPSQQQGGAPATTSGPSLSSVLTTIKNNEKKEQAIAQAAVSGANEVAQTAVSATEQTALSVAAMSVTSSQTSSTYSSSSSSNNDSSNSSKSSLSMGVPLATPNTQTGALQGSSTLTANTISTQGSNTVNQTTQQVAMVNVQPLQTSQQVQQIQSNQLQQLRGPDSSEVKNTDNDNTLFSNNFLTNRSNPMTMIVENNTAPNTSERNEQPSTTVKTNVQSNDLAGKVDIASIAVVPVGYNVYTGLILKDVAFYALKEIYRNQTNVDNTRLLRQLASDAKHEQMVNLQYGEKQ